MDWKGLIDDMNRDLATLRPEIAETMKGFGQMAKAATTAGELDVKTKELIALAIGVAVHCEPCIAFHARAAQRAGATRAEIAETLGMTIYMGGGPSLMYAAKAMAAFDELAVA